MLKQQSFKASVGSRAHFSLVSIAKFFLLRLKVRGVFFRTSTQNA